MYIYEDYRSDFISHFTYKMNGTLQTVTRNVRLEFTRFGAVCSRIYQSHELQDIAHG